MNIYSLYIINYLKWGDVCKSLLFLLVNLVTVSLHCSNILPDVIRFTLRASLKTRGYDWWWPEETKRFFSFQNDEKVILI